MRDIVVASNNEHKLKEIREILVGFNVLSMKDVGLDMDIVEDGSTFEENAIIKAKAVSKELNITAMADDSGLEIDCLGGKPGIYSARYLGRNTPYSEKNQIILDRLKNIQEGDRGARFVCAIAIAFADGTVKVVKANFEGEIAKQSCGENGFGYDPIFYVPSEKKCSAELSDERKNQISHRGKALRLIYNELIDCIED